MIIFGYIVLGIVALMVVLALIGRASIEALTISTSVKPSLQTFKPGMNRVEYLSKGKKIVANLFIPEDYKAGEKRPAVVISNPGTAVKEQAPHIYAEKFSKLGYITIAHDPRGIGESEGIEQYVAPDHQANDIASSIDFLTSLPQVDAEKMFNIGVCAGNTASTYETLHDPRVKALGMIVPSINAAEIMRADNIFVRWLLYAVGGFFRVLNFFGINVKAPAIPSDPEQLANAHPLMGEIATYYPEGQDGYHPGRQNTTSATSLLALANYNIFDWSDKLENTPVYMATGDQASSFEPAVRFYNSLNGPKDSLIVEGANHVDFYRDNAYSDQAAERIDAFFKKHA